MTLEGRPSTMSAKRTLGTFPPAPPECRDPELYLLTVEHEFCRWHPEYGDRARELREAMEQPELLDRLRAALADPSPKLRLYAGQLLVGRRTPESVPIALRLLEDPDE